MKFILREEFKGLHPQEVTFAEWARFKQAIADRYIITYDTDSLPIPEDVIVEDDKIEPEANVEPENKKICLEN